MLCFAFLRSLIFSLALWIFSWLLIPRLSPQYQGNPNVPWLILQLQQYCNVLCCNLQCVIFCILTSFFAIHPIFSSQDSSADFTARLLHCIAIDAFWGASWYTDCHCNPNIPKIIVELYHYHCIELNCILAYFVCIISAVCLSVLKCVGFLGFPANYVSTMFMCWQGHTHDWQTLQVAIYPGVPS